ncbi:hypothetical protein cyc_02160 [Cyclospora cayetanensis]|uniref:Secreted protein n=1 Tax=Cyclospora cayetanensis TaxID=88456 RepID=A0A1D3D9V8_9EIME|nr:hypothetical protein cyc_02160 [Cyclospora cayetanensis]
MALFRLAFLAAIAAYVASHALGRSGGLGPAVVSALPEAFKEARTSEVGMHSFEEEGRKHGRRRKDLKLPSKAPHDAIQEEAEVTPALSLTEAVRRRRSRRFQENQQ